MSLWFSHTAAETLATCPAKYGYKYVERLERKSGGDTDIRRLFGRQFHEAQAEYWGTGGLEAAVAKWDSLVMPWESKIIGRTLLIAYAAYYTDDKEYRYERTVREEKLRVSLGGIEVTAVPDLFATDEFGQRALVEHKTTSQDMNAAAYWTKVQRSLQGPTYLLVAKELGIKADYVLWDAIRVPWTKRRRATPLDKREFYVKTGLPKPKTYLEDEPEESFQQRVFEAIAKYPPDWFRRERLTFTPAEMRKAENDIDSFSRLGQVIDEQGLFVRNPDGCYKYGSVCEYEPLCWSELSLEQKSQLYQIRPRSQEPVDELAF